MARRTDSNSPADWLFIASRDLEGVRELASRDLAYAMCVSKLAEILETNEIAFGFRPNAQFHFNTSRQDILAILA